MTPSLRAMALLLALPLLGGACASVGTAWGKLGQAGPNAGFEVPVELPTVVAAAVAVLQAHGYQVSQRADPAGGAEAPGLTVVGERLSSYDAAQPVQTRDRVEAHLCVKRRFGGAEAVPPVTLMGITGGNYLLPGPGADQPVHPLAPAYAAELRGEVEQKAMEARSPKSGDR